MKKIIVIALALVMVLSLAACQSPSPTTSASPSAVPTSPSPSAVPPKVVTGFFPEFWGNYPTEDQLFIKEIQERSGIDLQLDVCLPGEDWNARCMLALMANDQADIIWCIGAAWQYFQSGSLLDITEVVPTKIPNLQKIIDELPGVNQDLKDDNGRIYVIPNTHQLSVGATSYAINQTILEDNNKTKPETWDEVFSLCKDLKAAGVEYPIWQFMGQTWWAGILGAYNTGGVEGHEWYFNKDTEEMRYGPYSDADTYKEIFAFTTQFYTEGLISPDAETTINNWGGEEWQGFLKSGDVFMYTVWWDEFQTSGPGGTLGTNFVAATAIYGPDGKYYANNECCIETYGAMGIRGKNHENLYEFLNFIYSQEATDLYEWGVEGVTYEVDDQGNKHYLESFKHNPDKSLNDMKKEAGMTIFHFPMNRTGSNIAEAQHAESVYTQTAAVERTTLRGGKPRMDQTKAEADEYGPKWNAAYGIIKPVLLNYLNGTATVDSYDGIVDQMKTAGIEDCIRIKNAQLARYLAR